MWLLHRLQRRWVWALITALVAGILSFLWAWLGLPSRYRLNYPRPLSEAWTYFPLGAAIGLIVVLLMPKSFDKDLGL